MPTKAERPSEGGHWYDQHGNQIAEVERSSGKGMRKPTLRDARKNNWGPGVTTIIGCAAAPGLNRWRQQQAALSAIRIHRYVNDTDEDWMSRVLEDAAKIAKEAAAEGSRIHKAIEQHYRGEEFDKFYRAHVLCVADLIEEHCPTATTLHPWLAEQGIAHPWGYGTKADLHSEAWVLDFKGRDGNQDVFDNLRTYESHWMQLAATRQALGGDTHKRCAIVYISRTHPGTCSFVEVTEDELERGLAMFKAQLDYWQAKQRHKPEW
tara:strand:- start:83 stop:874 length:792 start_codon:yes stop_codon:yes gene_type:complete